MDHDVIVIGGSYAGLAAALQLLRARRKVLVVDAGQRRNRFAGDSHGFLGQDGADPAALAATARAQVQAYPTLDWIDGQVREARGGKDGFTVETGEGGLHHGRRLLFATGVIDLLPDIDGLADRWGRHVFHCPYCHGYELGEGRIGVIGTGPMSVHQAQLLPEWGTVTFLTDGRVEIDPPAREDLARRGVTMEETRIARIEGAADVVLEDGRVLPFAGLFTASQTCPASPVAEGLGCEMTETPMGTQVKTDAARETSIPGAYACGDVARAPHSLSLAVADGAWAGAQLHRSLVWPDG